MTQHRAFRIAAWLAALAIISLPVVAVLNGWLASERWPFRQLSVNGEFRHVSLEQIRAAASRNLEPGFFAVDLERVRADVAALPWVEQVEVRKRWPDQIALSVVERQAVASWGDEQLLSGSGELFAAPANTVPEGLPRLSGPVAQRREIWDFYVGAEQQLRAIGLAPTGVMLSGRGAWTLPLSNGGTLLLGRTEARARLQRFSSVFAELGVADASLLLRADLRYANGFALRWQESGNGSTPETTPATPVDATAPSAPSATESNQT